jgi:hypothetical protein
MKLFLEQLTPFTKLLIPLIFVSSVIYDYTFLNSLGISFNQISTSLGEHLRSAIIWTPVSLLLFLFGTATNILSWKLMDWAWPDGATPPSSRDPSDSNTAESPEAPQIRQSGLVKLFLFVGRTVIALGILFGILWLSVELMQYAAALTLGEVLARATTLWIAVSWIFFRSLTFTRLVKKEEKTLATMLTMVAVFGPALCGFAGFKGFEAGTELLTQTEDSWTVVTREGNQIMTCEISGFRRFDKVTIIVDSDVPSRTGAISGQRRIRLVPTDAIERIEKKNKGSLWSGLQDRPPQTQQTDDLPANCRWIKREASSPAARE